MKAVIKSAKFKREYENKFGKMFLHEIEYDGKKASYSSKKRDQTTFVAGQEAEFTEEEHEGKSGKYLVIKPIRKAFNSNFSRNLSKEQTRYSGFAVSYVKDLIVAGILDIKDWERASEKIFNHMVNLDKTLQQ